MDVLEMLLRTLFSILFLFIVTKIMGYRQISQLAFYDYVIGITIGSIAADMATEIDVAWWKTVVPLVLYGLASILLSWVTIKSMRARRFLTGVPIILIQNGEILMKNMKLVHYDLSDLLAACRTAGYFNISDLKYAVMEHTGNISFLPYEDKRPCTTEDLGITPKSEGLVANLIVDGKVMPHHLKHIGKEEQWLKKELAKQHVTIAEILLATYDQTGTLAVFKKNNHVTPFNVVE